MAIMQALYSRTPARGLLLLIAALLFGSCNGPGTPDPGPPPASPPTAFDDVSAKIPFSNFSMQFLGDGLAGAAWFDYNNDGWVDLFLTNGKQQSNALFHNNGDGTFKDVATDAGVANGQGNSAVIAADFDNDGYQDLFLIGNGGISPFAVGPSLVKLYRNKQDGTFEDITAPSGIGGPETQMDAAAGDINNDGFLDLYITSPGSFAWPDPNTIPSPEKAQDTPYRAQLWLNKGDLTFENISASAGVDTILGSCVVMFSDYDDDGWQDIFVGDCNELTIKATPIELYRNNGDSTFTNVSGQAGLAPVGYWMCMAPGDFDNDGRIDIFLTNFGLQAPGPLAPPYDHPHALYRNQGDGTYVNVAASAKVGQFEFGWGGVMTDFNNDGWADIFYVGTLGDPRFQFIGPGLGSPGRLFANQGDGTFDDATDKIPVDLSLKFASGVAHGDFDNDGFEDIVVALSALPKPNTNPPEFDPNFDSGAPVLPRNQGNGNNWLKIRTQGTTSNRDGVGARVEVVAGGLRQVKEVFAGLSFASTNSPWLNFGLGSHSQTDLIKVRWPLGLVETFPNQTAGQTVTLVEGSGTSQ